MVESVEKFVQQHCYHEIVIEIKNEAAQFVAQAVT